MTRSQQDWQNEASLIIKAELSRRGVSYLELAERLALIGTEETVSGIKGKIHRGTFSFAWFLQCLNALGINEFMFKVFLEDGK